MTFDVQEQSIADGQPVFLYQFARTGASTVRLIASQDDETWGGQSYTASEISHGNIRTSSLTEREEFEVVVSRDNTSLSEFFDTNVNRGTVTISKVHRTDLDTSPEIRVIKKGPIVNARIDGETRVFVCNSIMSDTERVSLHSRAMLTCRWVHFGEGCGLTLSDFQTTSTLYTVTDVSGRDYTLNSTPTPFDADLSFQAGDLSYNGESRTVEKVTGAVVTLLEPFEALTDAFNASGPAPAVYLVEGCKLNTTTCAAFSNIENYGGFDQFPPLGAFDGRSIL